jgi:hypothetical protein NreA
MDDEKHRRLAHAHHQTVITRLKRAEGHLRSTVEMIAAGRSCIVVAQQLQAVEAAVANAKRLLIQDHIDHCLEEVAGELPRGSKDLLDEFKAVAKLL